MTGIDLNSVSAAGTSDRARNRRRFPVLLVAGAIVATGALLPSSASAASRASGCFSYKGVAVAGLSTNLEVLTTANTWRYLGAPGTTGSNGCVTYTIRGTWRNFKVRIRATAVVPAWRAMLNGATPYYAPWGTRTYHLGTGGLGVFALPVSAPQPPSFDGLTSGWLDEIGDSGSRVCNGNSSPAMLVACYMDAHGLHGNVIVLDYDGDGVEDDVDLYPGDRSRW